ncbi:MAG: hypothetical protein ACK2UI_12425 [Anaerolineae bacterium]
MSKQDTSSAVYNILAYRFDGKKGSEEALKESKLCEFLVNKN